MNTNLSVASAALTWMFISWSTGKPSSLGFAAGAVVGLVSITPASAIVIGIVGSALSRWLVLRKEKIGTDDPLDVFACHGIGEYGKL